MKWLVLVFLFIYPTFPLDSSWIPADSNGPLPLSQNYLDQLRPLCNLLKDPTASIPARIKDNEKNIQDLCKQLDWIDSQSKDADDHVYWLEGVGLVLMLAGIGYIVWNQWGWRWGMGWRRGVGYRGDRDVVCGETKMREARLKKFEVK